VRADPDLATSTRYFSGDEQSQLEQHIRSSGSNAPGRVLPIWRSSTATR
jgi:hypothetical protein